MDTQTEVHRLPYSASNNVVQMAWCVHPPGSTHIMLPHCDTAHSAASNAVHAARWFACSRAR